MEGTKGESKYERLRKIGIGSYGVVFKCVNRQSGQIVAIKRYSENDSDPIIRKIAMREVRMLRQLKHPNLIHLIEVFRRKRRLHLVFDYCELTVLDVIEKYANNCPLNLIRKIIWQLVNGVSHCHSHNCIHRDIKPENILINQSGVVKLCDFGFARNINSRVLLQSQSQSQSTNTIRQMQQLEREAQLLGCSSNQMIQWQQQQQQLSSNKENSTNGGQDQVIGDNGNGNGRQALTEYVATRWYRAPELLVGEIYYDTKIDIWAIGCVTAELMRGEPLWPGKTDLDQLNMIRNSLGPLTNSQAHTLVTQNLYDQINTERLLSQSSSGGHNILGEPLERRLPIRVGQPGIEFVLLCLQMDPTNRPNSEQLLQHNYIHSARMPQFIRDATEKNQKNLDFQQQKTFPSLNNNNNNNQSQQKSPSRTMRTSNQSVASSNSSTSSPPYNNNRGQLQTNQQVAIVQGDIKRVGKRIATSVGNNNNNSTQQQQHQEQQQQVAKSTANKRLVLATDNCNTSPAAAASSSSSLVKHNHSFVPIATSKLDRDNVTMMNNQLAHQIDRNGHYKRKLPTIINSNGQLSSVRIDRDLHLKNHYNVTNAHQIVKTNPRSTKQQTLSKNKQQQQFEESNNRRGQQIVATNCSSSSSTSFSSPYHRGKISQSIGNLSTINNNSNIPQMQHSRNNNISLVKQQTVQKSNIEFSPPKTLSKNLGSKHSTNGHLEMEKSKISSPNVNCSPLKSQTSQQRSSSTSFLPAVVARN